MILARRTGDATEMIQTHYRVTSAEMSQETASIRNISVDEHFTRHPICSAKSQSTIPILHRLIVPLTFSIYVVISD